MTLQGSQPKRRSGVVASADLLPLDASVIPESCAPQLRAAKKSPTVQLGADVMSKRECDSLGSGDATAPRKRGAAAFDPTDCTTWPRQKLMMHQRWEAATLPCEEHVNVDQKHHDTWLRFRRAGGFAEGIAEVAPKASGGNRKREAAAVSAGPELPSVSDMMKNVSQYAAVLNSKLLLAAHAFKSLFESRPDDSERHLAQSLQDEHQFSWRTIQKNGVRLINDSTYVPDIRGGQQTLAHNPQSDAFFQHMEDRMRREDPQGQNTCTDLEAFVKSSWLSFFARNDAAVPPDISKKTMDRIIGRVKTFAKKEPATKKAEHVAEALDDPRNVISQAAVATALLAGRPAELKGNYDDTSFMVAEEMGIKAIGYTHKQVADQMKALGRNFSFHWENNGQKQCRMFVLGFLTTAAGKVPLCVVKFFDRQLPLQRTRIAKYYLGRLYNGCHLWWMFIRLPPQGEGSNNDEEVNRVVFRDLVLPVIEAEKLEYVRESKRLLHMQRVRAQQANTSSAHVSSTSQRSHFSAASHQSSQGSARSHTGLRTNALPPGNHLPSELYIRAEDNPALNEDGVAFAQRQLEEEADSDEDRGSVDEAQDVQITDESVGLLSLTGNGVSDPVEVEDLTGTVAPSIAWNPDASAPEEMMPLSEIERQLDQEQADSFAIRFGLTTDGACPQMGSLMGMPGHCSNCKGVIHDYFAPAGNDCAKGPSTCSSFGNANDAGRCHCQLKDYIKRYLNRKPHWTSRLMKDFLQCVVPTLGLEQATVRTINYFCGHLEDMICKVWTPPNIKSGYVKAGLLADNPSGIDVDVILGHWVGMAQIRQDHYDIIRGSIPLFAEEALRNTVVSDASMACLEQYFPRPWKTYKVDRALSSWPRMRAAILVADQSKHLRNKKALAAVVAQVGMEEEDSVDPPLSHGYVQERDKKKSGESVMMRVCGCRAAAFKNARLYPNTAEGWRNHKKGKPHQSWLSSKQKHQVEVAVASEDAEGAARQGKNLFSDHPFAQADGNKWLTATASRCCLSYEVANRFAQYGLSDNEVPMLALMRPELFYSFFGITHANAVKMADDFAAQADRVVATCGCAVDKGFSFVNGFSDAVGDGSSGRAVHFDPSQE